MSGTPSGLGTAIKAVYASAASAADKAILIAIAHYGDWEDAARWRSVSLDQLALNTGYARSTVAVIVKRLTDGGVLRAKRTSGTSLRQIDWSVLASYVSTDGRHLPEVIHKERKKAVDNPGDSLGKSLRSPDTGLCAESELQTNGVRTTDERSPNYGLTESVVWTHTSSSPPPLLPLSSVERERRARAGAPTSTAEADRAPPTANPPTPPPAPPPPPTVEQPKAAPAKPVTAGPSAVDFMRNAPPWLLAKAMPNQVRAIDLGVLVVSVGRRLSRDAKRGLDGMHSDGPTLLAFWESMGAPDPIAFGMELQLVADAFHACPDPLFARFVRSEGSPNFPNRKSSMATLCDRKHWTDRLTAARLWDQSGRPLVRSDARKSGASAVTPGAAPARGRE